MQNHTHERNGFAGLNVLGRFQGHVGNHVNIGQSECVAAFHHYVFVISGHLFHEFDGIGLVIFAVVRFVFIKVRVQIRTHGGQGDAGVAECCVNRSELFIEQFIGLGRDTQCKGSVEGLGCRVIGSAYGVTVVDGLDGVSLSVHAVKRVRPVHVSKVEFGVDFEAFFVGVGYQIGKAFVAAHSLGPLQLSGVGVEVHGTVSKTGQTEVNVGNTQFGQLVVHGLDVFEGGQRCVNFHGEGQESFQGFDSTEGFDEQRDVFFYVFQLGQSTGFGPVVTKSGSHALVGSVVVILHAAFGSHFRVSQQEVADTIAFGVFPFGGNRPGGGTGYGNGVSQVISVGRTGSELCIYGVVGMQSTAVFGHQGCQGVTFGNQSHIAQGVGNGFTDFFGGGSSSGSSSIRSSSGSIGAGGLGGDPFGSDFAVIGYNAPYRPAHNFGVLTGDFMVRIVCAINLTGNVIGDTLNILETDQRTGTVGDHGITAVGVGTGAEVGQDLNGVELVGFFVEFDTVGGQTDFKAAVRDLVFQSQTETGRSSVVAFVTGHGMVNVQFFVGVQRTPGLDDVFQFAKLSRLDVGVTYVNSHFQSDGELGLHFDDTTFSQFGSIGVLQGVEGFQLFTEPVVFNVFQNQSTETAYFDQTGNQTGGLLFTQGIFYTHTALDVLQSDLTTQSSFLVGVHFLGHVVVQVVDDDLRQQLLLYSFGSAGSSSHINGVGEEGLTAGSVHNGNFAGEFFKPELVAAFFLDHNHFGQLLVRVAVNLGHVVDDGIFIFVYLICPRGVYTGGKDPEEHNQSKECRKNSAFLHNIFSPISRYTYNR